MSLNNASLGCPLDGQDFLASIPEPDGDFHRSRDRLATGASGFKTPRPHRTHGSLIENRRTAAAAKGDLRWATGVIDRHEKQSGAFQLLRTSRRGISWRWADAITRWLVTRATAAAAAISSSADDAATTRGERAFDWFCRDRDCRRHAGRRGGDGFRRHADDRLDARFHRWSRRLNEWRELDLGDPVFVCFRRRRAALGKECKFKRWLAIARPWCGRRRGAPPSTRRGNEAGVEQKRGGESGGAHQFRITEVDAAPLGSARADATSFSRRTSGAGQRRACSSLLRRRRSCRIRNRRRASLRGAEHPDWCRTDTKYRHADAR